MMRGLPFVWPVLNNTWRRDDIAAVAANINTRANAGIAPDTILGIAKENMSSAAPSEGFYGMRYLTKLAFKIL